MKLEHRIRFLMVKFRVKLEYKIRQIVRKIARTVVRFPAKWYFNRQFNKAFTDDYDAFWVVDIDNTIAHTWEKMTPHYIEQFASVSERMMSFAPFPSMQALFQAIPPRTRIVFLSARQYIRYSVTKRWLTEHGFLQPDSVIVLVENMRDKGPLLESVLNNYFAKKPTPQYLTNNSAIDKAISKTDIISYLKNGKSLNNNYSLVYFDDLSYNHEYGEILYYENVLAAVKKMPIQYICYNELLVMQGVIEV